MPAAAGLASIPSTPLQRRRAALLVALVVLAAAGLAPWVRQALPAVPHWVGLFSLAVALVDGMTFLLLLPSARESRPVAWAAAAYLYGGCMALLYLLMFPGAVTPEVPLLQGRDGAVGWIYLGWRMGLPALLMMAVLSELRQQRQPGRPGLLAAGVVALVVVLHLLSGTALPSYFVAGAGVFPPVATLANALTVGLGLGAAALIWRTGLLSRTLYLTLALVLVFNAIGMTLSVSGGSRYSLGWYASRIEHLSTALMLLTLLLRHVSSLWGEQQFRSLADHSPVLMWQTDSTGNVFVNQAYAEFVGQPAPRLLGMGWTAFVHPDDVDRYVGEYAAAYERRARYTAQLRMRRHDGEYRWMQSVGLPHAEPGRRFAGYIGSSYDITELKLNEQRLAASEAWFRDMADTAPTILWVTDEQGSCTFLSRGWYDLTGQPRGQGLGLGWVEAVHPDDRERAREAFLQALGRREAFRFDYRLRGADGLWGWYIDMGAPRFAADGRFLGHVGSVVDINDRKLAELDNLRLNEALREADRRKDEFLATLAHELRNPLAPLRHALAVVRRAPGTEAAQRSVGMMERQLAHVVRLIDDLMDVARITQGRLSLVFAPVALQPLLQHVAQLHQPGIEAAGQHLALDLRGEGLQVHADEARLQQVVGNLLSNASKYSPSGTTITLTLCEEDGRASIQVRDEGAGLPPDRLEHAFERFSGLNRELGRQQPGLGLGLSVVRNLVELHGGRVRVHSEGLGRGATFVLWLPLLAAPAAHASATPCRLSAPPREESASTTSGEAEALGAAMTLPPPQPVRVLVIDDNRDAADTLGAALSLDGHVVEAVHQPEDAVEAALRLQAQVIFLDLAMPGLDGYEVARRLRAEPRLASATLVALTGFGSAEDRARTQMAGFDLHLVKPADIEAVGQVLRHRRIGPVAQGGRRDSESAERARG